MKNRLTDFYEKVKELRRLQKEYFRTRSQFVLQKCKNQERQVDKMIAELNLTPSQQQTLL